MAINGLALGTNNISAQLATKLDIAGGKVLQVVRATDTTDRTTTSTSYVDVTGMTVSITPQKNTSAILLIATGNVRVVAAAAATAAGSLRITDSSDNAISGAENMQIESQGSASPIDKYDSLFISGYATPATTSLVTYKLRFLKIGTTTEISLLNSANTGQLYAIEVSA
jgi:hypothetical protein